jgi:hypothetical protein
MQRIAVTIVVALAITSSGTLAQSPPNPGSPQVSMPLPATMNGSWKRIGEHGAIYGNDVTIKVEEQTAHSISGKMTTKMSSCGGESVPFKGERTADGFTVKVALPNYNSAKPACKYNVKFKKNDRGGWTGSSGENEFTLNP